MTALHWSSAYVGTPYRELGRTAAGVDCWGLATIVYRAELGIVLPSYLGAYVSVEERAEIAALVGDVTAGPVWRDASAAPAEFDIAVFRRGPYESHVGILVGGTRMLHTARSGGTRIEDYSAPRWASRLAGIYRHRERL